MQKFSIALNEVNTLRRGLCWYVPGMETNLYALGISPSALIPSQSGDKNRPQVTR